MDVGANLVLSESTAIVYTTEHLLTATNRKRPQRHTPLLASLIREVSISWSKLLIDLFFSLKPRTCTRSNFLYPTSFDPTHLMTWIQLEIHIRTDISIKLLMVSVMKTEEGPRGRRRRRTRGRRRARGGEEEEDAEKGGRRGGSGEEEEETEQRVPRKGEDLSHRSNLIRQSNYDMEINIIYYSKFHPCLPKRRNKTFANDDLIHPHACIPRLRFVYIMVFERTPQLNTDLAICLLCRGQPTL